MTKSELILLQNQPNTNSIYLEFGTGNSTSMAVNKPSLDQITSIKSDFQFWEKLKNCSSELDLAVKANV